MKIARGLKAAAKSLLSGPKAGSYCVAGKQVQCPHCENILFHKHKASMNTSFSSLAKLEWADREVCALECANCSRIEWFYDDVPAE